MTNLTYRAERALLGALLRNPDALDDIRFLNAGDFASDQHREVFHAIAAAATQSPDGSHVPFEFTVAFSAPPPGISVRYLQSLSEKCPDPAHVRAYARMVMESSLRRGLLAHADRLFRDAGDLHFEVGRFSRATASGTGLRDFPAHLMRLAHAMWTHARTFDPGTEIPNGSQQEVAPEGTVKDARSSLAAARGAVGQEQAQQEEEVLADLIQHYWQNSSVLDWLPADAFIAGPRREVYEAITALSRAGQPVDELTVQWHLASHHAAHQAGSDPAQADPGANVRNSPDVLGYVGLLAALPVADGVATMTGRALLDRHDRAQTSPPATGATAANGIPGPAASPDRQRQPAAEASRRTPAAAPPLSFGAGPTRQPDLIEPPPGPPHQPGPQPRP